MVKSCGEPSECRAICVIGVKVSHKWLSSANLSPIVFFEKKKSVLCRVAVSFCLPFVTVSIVFVVLSIAPILVGCASVRLWRCGLKGAFPPFFKNEAYWSKFVTFFAKVKCWSRSSLFVWDWNCRAREIASNCARFYRIAKCVTRRIRLDLCGGTHSHLIFGGELKRKTISPPLQKGGLGDR